MPVCRPRALAAIAIALASAASVIACSADPPCPAADLAPLDRDATYAVVLSDYASTAIAILDRDGDTITEAWLDSGTRATAISAGLGGDVVLPGPLVPGQLAILERYNADRLTRLETSSGLARSIDLRGDDPAAPIGASPNVQDALRIDERRALVSRANPSFRPDAPELARGDDVIVVDLEEDRVVQRIELDAGVVLDDGTIVYARPSSLRMVERGATRRVLVGLQRLDASWTVSAPAAIAVIDPDTGARTQLVALEGLSNCASLAAIPGAPDRVLALCTGDAFAPEAERRRGAGVLRLALSDDAQIAIERAWRAVERPDAPVPTSSPIALDASRALYVSDPRADADAASLHDRLVLLDLERGATDVVLEAGSSFVLGAGTYDPARELVLIPDAHARAVHRLDRVEPGSLAVRDAIPLPTCRTLPPRQIARIE